MFASEKTKYYRLFYIVEAIKGINPT